MVYSDKVIEHYSNPKNVGSFDKDLKEVGTGLVGAPACGDVMKLQIKVRKVVMKNQKIVRYLNSAEDDNSLNEGESIVEVIEDTKFKTFGCCSAIAASSLLTEVAKGKTIDEVMCITNKDLAEELSLPPVKIHCSILAEDAIKAAINDYKNKQIALRESA